MPFCHASLSHLFVEPWNSLAGYAEGSMEYGRQSDAHKARNNLIYEETFKKQNRNAIGNKHVFFGMR